MTYRLRFTSVIVVVFLSLSAHAEVVPEVLSNTQNSDTISGNLLREKTEEYLTQVDRQIAALDSYLNRHYKNFDYAEDDVPEYVSNPINAFTMIKRTALEWPKVRAILLNETMDSELEDILELKKLQQ